MTGDQQPGTNELSERLHRFSHDLKNKLGGTLEVVRMLATEIDAKERAEFSAFAEKNVFHALRTLEELMDELGVERGVQQITIEDLDLNELIRQATRDLAARLERREQHLSVELIGDLHVPGDRELLLELLRALLNNASRYSDPKSTIKLSALQDGGRVMITVQDQGQGLSDADLKELFTRYAWLSTRSTDGSGQARATLSRAKHWAELHGGALQASSEGPGTGSTFTLRLPGSNDPV